MSRREEKIMSKNVGNSDKILNKSDMNPGDGIKGKIEKERMHFML